MRDALRTFRTQPAYAAAVAGVLAICSGATTALFTVVNARVPRPLPFHSRYWLEK